MGGNKFTFLKDNLEIQGKQLAKAMCDLLKTVTDEQPKELLYEFAEIYPIRRAQHGEIIKVGLGLKRNGGRLASNKIARFIRKLFPCWKEKLFLLTSEGLGYCNNKDDKNLRDNMFLDSSLEISCSQLSTKKNLTIIVRTSSRKMKIRFLGILDGFCWLYAMIKAIERSRYCKVHRFGSFAPHCEENFAKWYINGEQYFADVADTMKEASSKIFIAGWMLSPGLYLKRPSKPQSSDPKDHEYRLDNLLLAAAKRGVKVNILLYKEFDHALPNNSKHAKDHLESLHGNITVLRHPGALTMLWSHHEKLVIIDQAFCFMGGLDLCFGRFDSHDYHLREPGGNDDRWFPGQDYYNVRIKDFKNVENWNLTLIDVQHQPRMPWRDIAVQLSGEIVKDTTRHFIQYWNFVKVDLSLKQGRTLNRAVTRNAGDQSPTKLVLGGNKKRDSTIHLVTEEQRLDSSDEEDNQPFKKAMRRLSSGVRRGSSGADLSSRLQQQPSFLGALLAKYVETKDEDIKVIKKTGKENPQTKLRRQNEARAILGASKRFKDISLFEKFASLKVSPSIGDNDIPMSIRTITVKAQGEDDFMIRQQSIMASLMYFVSQMER